MPAADCSPPLHPLDGAAGLDVPLGQQEQQQGITRQGMLTFLDPLIFPDRDND